ncbi:hypothetical protein D3C87_323330 [compost metagenome]
MHRRKDFLVYPPNYSPQGGKKYERFKSLLQAKKRASKLGIGSEIWVSVCEHPAKFTRWNRSENFYIGEIVE